MTDNTQEEHVPATSFFRDPVNRRWLASAGILTVGLVLGGYLLGDGLTRARQADRSVTVRGLAEREVMADLATCTLTHLTELAASRDIIRRLTGGDADPQLLIRIGLVPDSDEPPVPTHRRPPAEVLEIRR